MYFYEPSAKKMGKKMVASKKQQILIKKSNMQNKMTTYENIKYTNSC